MDRAAIDWLLDATLAALDRGEPVDPWSLTFLLRCYRASDRADIRQALEPALAEALDRLALARTDSDRAAWLMLMADALSLTDDDRLHEAATRLVRTLRSGWGHASDIDLGARSVEACLRASRSIDLEGVAADAIDELERLVAAAYSPGEGLARGGAGAHVALSSALLTAYEASGRLPYSMLAEELMQFARRTLWHDEPPSFRDPALDPMALFLVNCDAARVLCWLAALHADEDYRRAAVIRPGAAYADDAAGLLSALAPGSRETGTCRGAYGLALQEWLELPRADTPGG